jgi:hypothetical protein
MYDEWSADDAQGIPEFGLAEPDPTDTPRAGDERFEGLLAVDPLANRRHELPEPRQLSFEPEAPKPRWGGLLEGSGLDGRPPSMQCLVNTALALVSCPTYVDTPPSIQRCKSCAS